MTSKRPAAERRAKLPRRSDHTRAFAKDWERLSRSGRYDLVRLKSLMLQLIANEAPLSAEWRDHPLRGEWSDCRECHVGGDFLLIYRLNAAEDEIVFVRAGTHAELFES